MAPLMPQEDIEVPSLAHTLLGAPYEAPLRPGTDEWDLHVPSTSVDSKDHGTGDAWIPRDPRILRLTGRHPLNCEPQMSDLMAAGFITPPPIHYVRNHGAVPKIQWADHRLVINGLVDTPLNLSMDELVALPSVTKPITLVCAGNRRKEENMIKKSIGFNWGPCAVSTSYWTGVPLRDLLIKAGVKTPRDGAKHVSFRGPKGELPKGDDGSYGTSLTWAKAMDPASDVIIAYKQNGRWLTPDHGFPVRIIIPGFIGGRMVKWLEEITVTETESQNHYHFFDNRVLPSHVDQDLANKEGIWYKPDYIINDLNINSAIAKPWHDEVVMLNEGNRPYTVRGYAYAGGGRKIIRVEISLDCGLTWRLAEIRRFEEPTDYGKYWCWVHWDIDVPTFDFFQSKELHLRAWDDTQNTQPAVITWNVMGMMNNCHFRVLIHPYRDAQGNMGVRFQHPAPVELGELGNMGWREEENLRKQALETAGIASATGPLPSVKENGTHANGDAPPQTKKAAPVIQVTATANGHATAPRQITMAEVQQHTSEESAWFVHEGKVYDATPFLAAHPGGADSILIVTGQDATEDFNAIHSKKALAMLADYYIGDLVDPPPEQQLPAPAANGTHTLTNGHANGHAKGHTTANGTSDSLVTLNPREKISLTLTEKQIISPDTRIFRFALPSAEHTLGLPTGKHVLVYGKTADGQTVARAYTPVSDDKDTGRLDLLVKVYFASPDYPEGGKMSQLMEGLQIGDSLQFKGPTGHFTYMGKGEYTLHKHQGRARRLSMVAGGTGITPMYQVIKAILRDPEDTTQISLLYSNRHDEDILLREELEALANNNPDRFKLYCTLTKPSASWAGMTGRIDQALMQAKLFPAGDDTLGLMCGPEGLLDLVAVPGFAAMGYDKDRLVNF